MHIANNVLNIGIGFISDRKFSYQIAGYQTIYWGYKLISDLHIILIHPPKIRVKTISDHHKRKSCKKLNIDNINKLPSKHYI